MRVRYVLPAAMTTITIVWLLASNQGAVSGTLRWELAGLNCPAFMMGLVIEVLLDSSSFTEQTPLFSFVVVLFVPLFWYLVGRWLETFFMQPADKAHQSRTARRVGLMSALIVATVALFTIGHFLRDPVGLVRSPLQSGIVAWMMFTLVVVGRQFLRLVARS